MRITRLWLDADLHPGKRIDLPPDRFNYLKNVLRLRDGFTLTVFDGRDRQAEARLHLEKRHGSVEILGIETRSSESPLDTHLLQAMAKGEKVDWVIQKAVELGVGRITPVTTERSMVELAGERAEKRQRRFREIAINACEQCGRNRLPVIDPIQSMPEALAAVTSELRWVLHPVRDDDQPAPEQGSPESAALLIGPEGGFSDEELAASRAHGFARAQLGPRVLRTETAAVVGLTSLQVLYGDLAPRISPGEGEQGNQ